MELDRSRYRQVHKMVKHYAVPRTHQKMVRGLDRVSCAHSVELRFEFNSDNEPVINVYDLAGNFIKEGEIRYEFLVDAR